MTTHKKHDDKLDVQVRTRILDEYGNPIEGAIEYDPVSGYGKKIVDPGLGLTAPFFRKGGSVEIDGHNFDDTNEDLTEIDSIKEMIDLKVSRNDPTYDDLLKQKLNTKRAEDKQKNPGGKPEPLAKDKLPKIVAITQIAKGEEIKIDLDTGEARGTRADNILKASDQPKIHTIGPGGTKQREFTNVQNP